MRDNEVVKVSVGLDKDLNENRMATVGLCEGCLDKKSWQRLGKGRGKAISVAIAFAVLCQRWSLAKGSVRIEWQRLCLAKRVFTKGFFFLAFANLCRVA